MRGVAVRAAPAMGVAVWKVAVGGEGPGCVLVAGMCAARTTADEPGKKMVVWQHPQQNSQRSTIRKLRVLGKQATIREAEVVIGLKA